MYQYENNDPYGYGGGGYPDSGDPGSGTGTGTGTTSGGRHLIPGGNGWWDAVAQVWRTFTEPIPRTTIPT